MPSVLHIILCFTLCCNCVCSNIGTPPLTPIKKLGVATEDSAVDYQTQFIAECELPTKIGGFRMRSYVHTSPTQKLEPIVLIYGDIDGKEDVLVRIHDQCFTSEVLGSLRCDCKEQLEGSMNLIKDYGGVLIYLQQEGRGIGLSNKIAAYALQDKGMDTVDANVHLGFEDEQREYTVIPDILEDLNVLSMKLITNNPFKINQIRKLGIKISSRVPMQINPGIYNRKYLQVKRERMMHELDDATYQPGHDEVFDHDLEHDTENSRKDKNVAETSISNAIEADIYTSNHTYIFGKNSVEEAIDAIRKGEIVVVVDDANRENEGDLIIAAEKCTPDAVGFIIRHTSGVLCVSLEKKRLDALKLPPMVNFNEDPKQTAYSVSVDCKHNTTTGISAADRANTFQALANPLMQASDFQRPGHVFPLRYQKGGVLVRAGHTEASLDLTRLAGLNPAGVLAEVVNDEGSVMRLDDLKSFAQTHGLAFTSVQDLIAYRYEKEIIS